MVERNNATFETLTVSVDLIGHGCTTGISASDRAKTIQALINPLTHWRNWVDLDTSSPARQSRRRAAPPRPHRGGRRFLTPGWVRARRCHCEIMNEEAPWRDCLS